MDLIAAGTVVALSALVIYGAKEGSMFNIGAAPRLGTPAVDIDACPEGMGD